LIDASAVAGVSRLKVDSLTLEGLATAIAVVAKALGVAGEVARIAVVGAGVPVMRTAGVRVAPASSVGGRTVTCALWLLDDTISCCSDDGFGVLPGSGLGSSGWGCVCGGGCAGVCVVVGVGEGAVVVAVAVAVGA
jgi:hypothetical protein